MAGPKPRKATRRQHFIAQYGTWIVLSIIVLIAVFFRFYHLNTLPPGLHPDEAANGQDILYRIFRGDLRPLYDTNGPRESLFFFLQAIFVKLLGNTILALRIAPALIGVAAVIMIYYWGTDWFGRRVGLFAAFFMAVTPWVVIISRDGFRASMTPLIVSGVAYFGGRAFKTKHMKYYIAAAAFLGLGAYTYTAFQLMIVASFALLAYVAVFKRHWLAGQRKNLIAAAITFAVILTPLAAYTVMNSGAAARAGGVSFLNKDLNHGKPLATLADSVEKTLLQYNFKGDTNARQNIPGEPYLNTFVGIMFILGILVALFAATRAKYFTVLAIFGAMMLPAALSAEGLPHGLRSIGSAPPVMLLAAIGLSYFLGRWYAIFPINGLARNVGLGFVSLLLLATLVQGYKGYFVAWAGDEDTYGAYAEDVSQMGKYMVDNLSGANQPKTYLVVDGYSIKTVDYLTYHKSSYTRYDWDQVKSIPLTDKPTVFLVQNNEHAQDALKVIKEKFPSAKVNAENSTAFPDHTLFYDVEVNR